MNRSLGNIARLSAIAVAIGTAGYGSVVQADGSLYDCCGNGSSPMHPRCQYTNRDTDCHGYDNNCPDEDYKICCTGGCETGTPPL